MSTPTPQERAATAVETWIKAGWFRVDHQLEPAIAAAVRAAVLAEREALARHFDDEGSWDFLGANIAAFIRARPAP